MMDALQFNACLAVDRAVNEPVSAKGYTEAEGYVASLRQMAEWVFDAQDAQIPSRDKIDIGDVDADELIAAAHHLQSVSTELAAAYERIGQLARSLHNARLQLEYLDERFQCTGSTAGVIAQIDAVLNDQVTSS